MIDKNKLHRIKGVLKAQQGGETPTLPKYTKQYNGQYIYSNDNQNWFSDNSLKKAFTGDITPFQDVTIQSAIPGDPNITPTTAVENSQQINDKVEELQENEIIKDKIKIPDTTLADWNDPIAQNMKNTSSTNLNAPTIELSKEMQQKLAEDAKNNSFGMNYEEPKNWSKWKKGVNFASNIYNTIGNTVGTSQLTTDSKLTKGLNNASKFIADGVEQMGPLGSYYSKMFKNLSIAGDIIQEMGGGTDQQTKMDKWMDSSFFSWNIGMLNGFAGKKSDSFGIDNSTVERVGGSYGGALAQFNEAAEKANKKYGLFSSKAREKTNKLSAEAKRKQNIMGNIADEAELQRLNAESGSEQTILNNQIMFDGGYNQKYTYAAKHGGILEQDLSIKLEWEPQIELNWELPEFQEGGSIALREELEWIPELQEGGKTRNIDELIEYAKKQNPRFIQRMSEPMKYLDLGNGERGSHLMSWATDDNGAIVYSQIQEDENGNLKDYGDQAIERAIDNNNILRMSPEEAKLFTESDEDAEGNLFGYKKGWPEVFRENYDFSQESKEYPQEYIDFKNSLPRNQRLTPESKYRTYEYWQSWGKPKNFEEAKKLKDGNTYMYNYDASDNSYHGSSTAWLDGVGYFTKPKNHDTVKYELDYYNKGLITEEGGKQRKAEGQELKDWEEFINNYDLVDDGNFYKYVLKNKKFKDGGQLNTSDIPEIEETTQKNVIPEGALHKNKHHMEHAEGLTKKGIPVVDEDGDQQAEIEHSEIIFTLEVTKKLEEYYDIFYSEDSSEKEKEQAAEQAGKLLVYQILENTDDRTGLIESCKKGGQLTHNNIIKSGITKNQMKEAMKEALLELLIK